MMCLSARFMRAWQRHPIMLVGEAVQYLFMGAFIGAAPPPPPPALASVAAAALVGTSSAQPARFTRLTRAIESRFMHVLGKPEGQPVSDCRADVAGGMYFDVSSEAERGTFDRAASSFFIIVTIVFTPPFTVITVWQDERTLVRREVDQNIYGLGVFFWSKTLVMVPVEILFALTVRPYPQSLSNPEISAPCSFSLFSSHVCCCSYMWMPRSVSQASGQ